MCLLVCGPAASAISSPPSHCSRPLRQVANLRRPAATAPILSPPLIGCPALRNTVLHFAVLPIRAFGAGFAVCLAGWQNEIKNMDRRAMLTSRPNAPHCILLCGRGVQCLCTRDQRAAGKPKTEAGQIDQALRRQRHLGGCFLLFRQGTASRDPGTPRRHNGWLHSDGCTGICVHEAAPPSSALRTSVPLDAHVFPASTQAGVLDARDTSSLLPSPSIPPWHAGSGESGP